jgi:hypothetical protein
MTMPIFSYFAVMGSALVALLFVADATLEKSDRLPNSSQFVGLPKPWRPEMKSFAANSAPAPILTSNAAMAVAPPATVKNGAVAWWPGDNWTLRGSPFPWRF